jgi:hypothetical protein
MRTTIDIEHELLRRLRAEAHRHGLPLKDVVNRALRRGLADGAAAKAPPYRAPTFAMGAPLRPLDKALALADALEAEQIARELASRK